jgi:asparagine synthase (glutamine-hydrolysing)
MMTALERRGPDSDGLHEWPEAVFGHRRLAILDLSPTGHQPMLSTDGQVGLVFNGCIYNFQEIRGELEALGYGFRSTGDTEVLLNGYLAWGIDALLKRLRGMWAFAIWDNRRRAAFLVRDRLGIKPLVYSRHRGGLAFASTPAALRRGGFGGGLDEGAVLDFLEFGYVTEERSIFEGIEKVPPATILEWSAGTLRSRQYWQAPEIDEGSKITFEEAVEETERLIVDSVRMRLVSDVPLAALLSGGIDSTLVCWALRKLNRNFKAFTVQAVDDPADESAAAARTAALLGVPHEIVSMPQMEFSLDELTSAFSEPFSCPSALAMLWVSRAVKPMATVLLTGDGGDDVFLGYDGFYNAWRAQRLGRWLPAGAAALWQRGVGHLPRRGMTRRAAHFLDYATGGIGPHMRAHDGLPYYEQNKILGERLQAKQLALRQIPASPEAGRRLLQDVLFYHRKIHFTSEFMTKLDGSTMQHSLEAREPFLDRKIWEFAAALPPEIHFRGGRLKAILREIVRRHLGPEVAFRPKQGFTVPAERWYTARWRGMLANLREGTLLEKQGWVRRGSLDRPIDRAMQVGHAPGSLVKLLVLEHWLRSQPGAASRESISGAGPVARSAAEAPQAAGPNPRVKVCLLIDALDSDSGNEILLTRLADNLDPRIVETHVCCFRPGARLSSLNPAVRKAIFPLEKVSSLAGILQMIRFRRYVRENGIDATHSFVDKTSLFSVLALLGERRRAVITSRLNCGYTYTPFLIRTFRFLNRHTTRILVNSVAAKNVAMAAEDVPPEKVFVFYPGVDLAHFAASAGDPSATAYLGIPPSAPVVGIVANFRPVKNLALFLRAAGEVVDAVPEAVFLLVGQGPLRGELEELSRALGIADRVYYSSPAVAVRDYLARMSVACLSSSSESLPNAILEYMAHGLPVVATDVGGVSELVRDGETGYLVRTHTPEAFAHPIIRLLRDPRLREVFSHRALQLARSEFDGAQAVRRLEQFYIEAARSVRQSGESAPSLSKAAGA